MGRLPIRARLTATFAAAWLRGAVVDRPTKHPRVGFDMLNLWFFGDACRSSQPELAPAERVAGFAEVLAADRPIAEADRRDFAMRIQDAATEIRDLIDQALE